MSMDDLGSEGPAPGTTGKNLVLMREDAVEEGANLSAGWRASRTSKSPGSSRSRRPKATSSRRVNRRDPPQMENPR